MAKLPPGEDQPKPEQRPTFDRTKINEGLDELERHLDDLGSSEKAIVASKLQSMLEKLETKD